MIERRSVFVKSPALLCLHICRMWCPDCQQEFSDVPGAEVQVCPTCMSAARAGRKQRRVPKLAPKSRRRKTAQVKSPKSKQLIRIDGSHRPEFELEPEHVPVFIPDQPFVNGIANAKSKRRKAKQANTIPASKSSRKHVILFGLFVFLMGQLTVIWSFLAGHFTAWSIGNLFSILGLSISMVAILQTFRSLEQRIEHLSRLTTNLSKKKRKKRSKEKTQKST